jgi:hypothetical protein
MREPKYIWLIGLVVTVLIVVVPIALVIGGDDHTVA